MLNDLQANILKGHGRRFAYHIFLQLEAPKIGEAKRWISDFATNRVTSAFNLEQGRQIFKATGADGGAVFTISISSTGYTALGFTPDQFPKEKETPANSIVKDQPAFANGAKASATKLGDGDVQVDWEPPFRSKNASGEAQTVDVLIIVADNQAQKALQLADMIIAEVKAFSTVLLNQKGHVLYRGMGATGYVGIEHFGYADGLSEPLYYKDEIEAQASTKTGMIGNR